MNCSDWLSSIQYKSSRDKELLTRATTILHENILQGPEYPWSPFPGIIPSRSTYHGVWNWDAAFHAIAVARWNPNLAYAQCQIIWNTQTENGMFCDVIHANGQVDYGASKPPVFPWAFMRVFKYAPDYHMLSLAYSKYKKNEEFWRTERFENGLFHYDSIDGGIYAKYESGWDTSVRWDDFGAQNLFQIDLNCYMISAYRALAEMSQLLELEDAEIWNERENSLKEKINSELWDSNINCYTDITRRVKQSTGVLSPASFMPLYLGIATSEQAAYLAALAKDPSYFYPLIPTVSYNNCAYSSTDYWRGPTWLNTSYFVLKGLKRYGYSSLAEKMRDELLNIVHADNRGLFEYYDSRDGKGLGAHNFGWTAAFVIELILDF